MYSRYHARADAPVRIPENYGGTAFSEPTEERGESLHRIDVAKPTPRTDVPPPETAMPAPPRTLLLPPVRSSAEKIPTPTEKEHSEPSVSLSEPVHGKSIKNFPFGHGIGFDELLLLGLIVLLSGSEQGSDTVLWLALLLFMG